MDTGKPAFYFEVVDNAREIGTDLNKAIKVISAAEAFRKYDWLRSSPIFNVSGNLRGMVINPSMRTVYTITSNVDSVARWAGEASIAISLAIEIVRSRDDIARILNGRDDSYTKAAKLSTQVFGISSRVIWGAAAATEHVVSLVMRQMAWINPAYWIDRKGYRESLDTVDALVTSITTNWRVITSGDTLYYMLQVNLND